ncbi:hypothetical protein D9611_007000 [Ephemerocybe angulata]|uniref:Uncharacterized protein n=1 Tax=Ephemerocybe angulata TaxID=980116 RepID=A0A8H5B007_9AGAR|nr:hypothetical protein D9611_007000 [Tulosesus angulatus]
MNNTHLRFAGLPMDIGRIILEEAVSDATPMSWKWALLSKRVRTWLEPVLYRHVLLDDQASFAAFHASIMAHPAKSPNFFAMHVKTLAIPRGWAYPPSQVLEVLEACSGVHTLLLRLLPLTAECAAVFDVTALSLAPRRLSIFIPTFGGFSHSIFRNLTHLELLFGHPGVMEWDWADLKGMESLTHLCVRGPENFFCSLEESGAFLEGILPLVPISVGVIVLWVRVTSLRGAEKLGGMDPRVVVLETSGKEKYVDCEEAVVSPHVIFRNHMDLRNDWMYVACREEDYWSQAERKVQKRRHR